MRVIEGTVMRAGERVYASPCSSSTRGPTVISGTTVTTATSRDVLDPPERCGARGRRGGAVP